MACKGHYDLIFQNEPEGVRVMKYRLFFLLIVLIVPMLIGCPGARQIDREANEALAVWIDEQDATGWQIIGVADVHYSNVVVEYRFNPTRLDIAILGDNVNPFHQRNLIETIARQWQNSYPSNMKPRFNLKVQLYDRDFDRANDLGFTEIDEDGNVDTHHGRTMDKM
jgi:hypothetical protein